MIFGYTVLCLLLYCVKWTQYSIRLEAVRYMQQMFPWAQRSLQRKRHLDGFNRFCRAIMVTDWLTDRQLLSVAIGAVNSTDRINFSNQQLYSAVQLDGLQCIWRHTAI